MNIEIVAGKKALKRSGWTGVGYFEGDPKIPSGIKKTFAGKESDFAMIPKGTGAILCLGLGKSSKWTLDKARRAAARFLSQAKHFHAAQLAVDLESLTGEWPVSETVQAFAEGLRLASYRFDKYKSKTPPASPVQKISLVLETSSQAAKQALNNARVLAEAVYFTRDLANEPANSMTPPAFAAAVKAMAKKNGLSCRVLDKNEIKRLGMGGILGVSQGSSFPPQFVILENKPKTKAGGPVVLVGKGITFDTGGISIKPSAEMDKMKFDMCGAAAVAGTMKAVANLRLPQHVIGLMPVCENMPGSTAQRPGDIIRCLNGKTVEVLNTDAEGRLILADALSYAKRLSPRILVDMATLTGACAATFSDLATGLMGTDPALVDRIKNAGEKTGERCWELPLWDEYADLIRATYADIQNISKKNAGTITAGLFLKEFAEHTKSWAHLDIAGTAWNNGGAKPLSPIGATGIGVRLLTQLIQDL